MSVSFSGKNILNKFCCQKVKANLKEGIDHMDANKVISIAETTNLTLGHILHLKTSATGFWDNYHI